MTFSAKTILQSTALLAALALPATASDLDKLTDTERSAFRDEVRAYLLENPEVILEAMQVLRDREAQQEAVEDEQLLSQLSPEIFNDGVSFIGGNPDGDVTIVEFIDYRCGYCRRAHADMAELLKADGNVRWVVKEFPILGPDSDLASKLAVATLQHYGDEAYYRIHNVLMEFKGPVNVGTLPRIAKDAGIELDPIRELINSQTVAEHIGRMHALGQRLGVTGTPAFVIEDTILRGYLPLADMQNIVAEQRANAG
jgi:protein-disulfide isomerase